MYFRFYGNLKFCIDLQWEKKKKAFIDISL